MNPANKTFALKLSHQGLLMVAFVLAMELLILALFWSLLTNTEMEARRAERSREVLANLQKMLHLVYDGGSAIESYSSSKSANDKIRFSEDMKQTRAILASLKEAVSDDSTTLELVNRIDGELDRANTLTAEVFQYLAAPSAAQGDLERLQSGKKEIHDIELALIPQVATLLKIEKKIAAASPAAEKEGRDKLKLLIATAVPLNIIVALIVALLFIRTITARLAILVENTALLTEGARLRSPQSGSDEISQLDSVFHKMAYELRREEEKLKASEENMLEMIESMPIGLAVVQDSGVIDFINTRTAKMFACSADSLIGTSIENLFASGTNESDEPAIQHLLSKALGRIFEVNALPQGKAAFPIELTIATFPGAQKPGYLAIMLDVSERAEIQRLRAAFVAMVSHELRTPLTAIKGYLSLLEIGAYGQLPQECLDGAGRAEQNITRLITLTNDLLDLEKMAAGMLSVNLTMACTDDVLKQSFHAVQTLALERQVTLEIPEANWQFNMDPSRIVQVLVNLFANAIKFSPAGSTVKVFVERDNHWVLFKVVDQGRGIPERSKETIFEKFQQVLESDTRENHGVGLGLPVCKAIVEQHDGTIGVESREGAGSTFWFRLPV